MTTITIAPGIAWPSDPKRELAIKGQQMDNEALKLWL